MKIYHFFLSFSLLAAVAQAAAPQQLQQGRYTKLWTNSPFTSPPIVTGPGPAVDPFEDYSLGGISKLADGYFAILFNAKDPNNKIVIRPGAESDFSIVKVDWAANWKETVVTLRNGGKEGTVTFDEKQLTIKAAAPQKKAPAKPGQPAARPPGVPTAPTRKPRPRVVVPPKR